MSALTDERREELRDYIRGLRDAVDSEDWISEPEKHLLIYADLLALLDAPPVPPKVVSREWVVRFVADTELIPVGLRAVLREAIIAAFRERGIAVKPEEE